MHIIFRCDASESIGSGHLMRCRNLAKEFQKLGASCLFICRQSKVDFLDILENEFLVLKLKKINKKKNYEIIDNSYQIDDYQESIDALKLFSERIGVIKKFCIIVDHYRLDELWHKGFLDGIKSKMNIHNHSNIKLAVIDDLANRNYFSDIIVDQSVYGDQSLKRYNNKTKKDCILLLGPKFSLLGPEYEFLNKIVPPRKTFTRLFVFLGAKFNKNFINDLIEVLKMNEFKNINKDFLFFSKNGIDETHKELAKTDNTFNFYNYIPSLAGLIIRSDIAIGAGGTSNWERYCLGLPSLITSVANNQEDSISSLVENRISSYLGKIDEISKPKIFNSLIKKLENKKNIIYKESKIISSIVDGKGAKRVSKKIMRLFEKQK